MMLNKARTMSVKETCNRIPKNSVGVELGVWKGESSELFLPLTSKLYLVDAWSIEPFKESEEFGGYDAYLKRYADMVGSNNPQMFQKYYDDVCKDVTKRFENTHAEIIRSTTDEFFKTFDKKVDWVYVDASHSYDGCLSDLRNCLNILKKHGTIFGDDYHNKKGVTNAVDAFVQEGNFHLEVFAKDQYEIKI